MRKGDKGAQVETLQRALVRLGHALPKHGVDGDLGGETLGAARAFARAHGIEEPVDEPLESSFVCWIDLALVPALPFGWRIREAKSSR